MGSFRTAKWLLVLGLAGDGGGDLIHLESGYSIAVLSGKVISESKAELLKTPLEIK